jgi:thioredoxin reductase (NADPH)
MSTPIIFSIDDDPQVLRAIGRDLKSKFRPDYRILSTSSVEEALNSLVELKNKGETVSLFISDQKMPEMQGVEFLEKAKVIYPDAKRVLLTAYSDTDAAIKAINDVQLDYYLLKPWDPPEEKLYPVLTDLLEDWHANVKMDFKGIRVLGYQFSPKSHAIKDYLSGNLFPYQWLDIQTSEAAAELIEINGFEGKDYPVVIFEDGTFIKQPSLVDIASRIGLNHQAQSELYDVVIVGAGPAGLAAAVYAASEGLKTLLVEKRAPGGQAGTSSRIENYLGFPNGLSGSELTRRAITQATRFGTEFLSPQEVKSISFQYPYKILTLGDGAVINTRSLLITTGVNYRHLETEGIEKLTGAGVYYGAANTEAQFCKDKAVFIVGGGNSAGQAAMYLSKFAAKVIILIRKESLHSTMSSYLIDQIAGTPNIEVWGHTQVKEVIGGDSLEKVIVQFNQRQNCEGFDAAALFVFIGAQPVSTWLPDDVIKDNKGFVSTGREMSTLKDFKKIWKLEREPYLLETSIPGVFAAGDVRSGAMNRVASAVGEGAMAISFVHKYLAEI